MENFHQDSEMRGTAPKHKDVNLVTKSSATSEDKRETES